MWKWGHQLTTLVMKMQIKIFFLPQSRSYNNNKTKNLNDEQTRITFSSTLDLSDDKVYLYLPGNIPRLININKKNIFNYFKIFN